MLIDFNDLKEMAIPGMNSGTGTMIARMYNEDSYRIIQRESIPVEASESIRRIREMI